MKTSATRREPSGARGACVGLGVALLCLLAPGEAHAYLDAGTGSMILQVAIASVTGGLIAIRMYWVRIKARFFGGPPVEDPDPSRREPGNEPS